MDLPKGIHRVNISIPMSLKNVNCYLLEGPRGWSAVDAGLNYPAAKDEWKKALSSIGLSFSDIKELVITHSHVDHLGLAGWIQQKSGCRVFMSNQEANGMTRFRTLVIHQSDVLRTFMLQNGFTDEEANSLQNMFSSVDQIVKPDPQVELLADGDNIMLGDRGWQVFVTPGHAEGHVCLYDPIEEILISGDQILPTITSNISIIPYSQHNPLEDYIASLLRLKELKIKTVLPAHREPFAEAHRRIDELLAHHENRLQVILNAIEDGKNAAQITDQVFGSDLNSPLDRFLAVGETLAHLKVLMQKGLVRQQNLSTILFTRLTPEQSNI